MAGFMFAIYDVLIFMFPLLGDLLIQMVTSEFIFKILIIDGQGKYIKGRIQKLVGIKQ